MNVRNPIIPITCALVGLAVAGAVAPPALADHGHSSGKHQPKGELVRIVREATARFHDVAVAEAEGYQLHFGCVSADDAGAMGLHYVNMALVGDGELHADRPEIVIYEPLPGGRLRLVGADYLVLTEDWHARNGAAPPELVGQLLHLFHSPNRFGLPDFYTLHVWAWKKNPSGTFVNWHPEVSCEAFDGQAH
ncbi:MAG TPA: hypothetical protein VKZ85_09505 [Woeseiaceae bacterium]|nr:hypothetical protein [Woeseiaceae bacterium]